MSVQSKKINNFGIFPLQESEVTDKVPNSTFIKFNFNSLAPRRRLIALKQIEIYEKKYKLFPHKKSLYLEKINDLILYEKNKRWKV